MTAMRIITTGMKPGYINNRIVTRLSGNSAILLNTEAEITTGWIYNNNRENGWIIEGTVREDILNYKSAVGYLAFNAKIENRAIPGNKGTSGEIMPELGIRFNRKVVFMIFYQYIRKSSDNPVYDINREYHLVGVRIDI